MPDFNNVTKTVLRVVLSRPNTRICDGCASRLALIASFIGLVCLASMPVGNAQQTNLPPQVQAELLTRDIISAASDGRVASVLQSIDEYRQLGVKMPPPLLYLEARAADMQGQAIRAAAALEEFFSVADRDDASYLEALDLYSRLRPRVRHELLDRELDEAKNELKKQRYSDTLSRVDRILEQLDAQDSRRTAALEIRSEAKRLLQEREAKVQHAREYMSKRWVPHERRTVLDVETGLIWADSDNGSDIDWRQAKAYCQRKSRGWYLPTVAELRSLHNYDFGRNADGTVGDLNIAQPIRVGKWTELWSEDSHELPGGENAVPRRMRMDVRLGLATPKPVIEQGGMRALCVRRP